MIRQFTFYFSILIFATAFTACETQTQPKTQARVFFKLPADGATVTSPVELEFGSEAVKIAAAGKQVAGEGHHHILINQGPIAEGTVIPKDETHLHFGKGQKSAKIDLKPGNYKLTMQLADGFHKSYGAKLATTINITVK